MAKLFMVIRLLGGRSGGAERLFCEMANLLADEGYDVTVLCCDSSHEPPLFPLSPKVACNNLWSRSARRAPWYRAIDALAKRSEGRRAMAPFAWLSRNLYFTRRLQAAMADGKPDVVISFLPPANTPSLLAGWAAGAKVIPTNHNVPEQDYRSPHRWDQNPVDRWLRLRSLRSAARVHVLFPTFAEFFPREIRDKVVAIANFVSSDFAGVPQHNERPCKVVAAGRLMPVKNYMALIEAWALLADTHPDWSVEIYGQGPQHEELAARIDELGLQHAIELMGHSGEMRDAYLGAQILCHPALHEGFGLSVAEALACGLPVVAFGDCAGVNEFVRDGSNGLMVDRERGVEGLAEALDELISNEQLRAQLRARAPASIAQFSQAAFVARWTEVIDEVVALGNAGRQPRDSHPHLG